MKIPKEEPKLTPPPAKFRIHYASSGKGSCHFDIYGPGLTPENFSKIHEHLEKMMNYFNAGLPHYGKPTPPVLTQEEGKP